MSWDVQEKENFTNGSPTRDISKSSPMNRHLTSSISKTSKIHSTISRRTTYSSIKSKRSERFQEILLGYQSLENLANEFIKDIRNPRPSDAKGIDFSFSECIKRMVKGYQVLMFNYNTFSLTKILIHVDRYGILIKESKERARQIEYPDCRGFLIGNRSSTFQFFENNIQRIQYYGLNPTDCFSIITTHRNYDFASPSDRIKYDIYIVFSFFMTSFTQTNVPSVLLSKRQLTLYKIKLKLREMALERYLSLKELMMVSYRQLAIYSSLILAQASLSSVLFVEHLLNKSLSKSSKLYKFSRYFIPEDFKISEKCKSRSDLIQRHSILSRRKAFQLFNKDSRFVKMLGNWHNIKKSAIIFSFKSIGQYLEEKKNSRPSTQAFLIDPIKTNFL